MSTRDTRLMLREILESIAAIRSYLGGVEKEEFINNAQLQDAVIRRLEIIGEAANQIPEQVKTQHSEIEWRVITAMRNRLIHGYFSVNTEIVWNTARQSLSTLEAQVQALLNDLEHGMS